MTLDDCKALAPTPEDWAVEDQIIESLTAGNSLLLRVAGEEAARWLYAALIRCRATDRDFDAAEQEILRAAVHKRAVYELYTRGEVEASAEDKATDALGFLRAVLGDCADLSGGTAREPSHHVGAAAAADPRAPARGALPLAPWDWSNRNA